jgi:hypothetical protein
MTRGMRGAWGVAPGQFVPSKHVPCHAAHVGLLDVISSLRDGDASDVRFGPSDMRQRVAFCRAKACKASDARDGVAARSHEVREAEHQHVGTRPAGRLPQAHHMYRCRLMTGARAIARKRTASDRAPSPAVCG